MMIFRFHWNFLQFTKKLQKSLEKSTYQVHCCLKISYAIAGPIFDSIQSSIQTDNLSFSLCTCVLTCINLKSIDQHLGGVVWILENYFPNKFAFLASIKVFCTCPGPIVTYQSCWLPLVGDILRSLCGYKLPFPYKFKPGRQILSKPGTSS